MFVPCILGVCGESLLSARTNLDIPLDFPVQRSVCVDVVTQVACPRPVSGLEVVQGAGSAGAGSTGRPRMTKSSSKTTSATPAEAGATKASKTTKKDRLRKMLARKSGATLAQLTKDLGWQPHTVRAAISVLRKDGITVDLDRAAKTPAYRIAAEA
jgi:biotin operon repressor